MILALEDGTAHFAYAVGEPYRAEGELVFNTAMTGYQEVCTDPSYRGQLVVLTYPLIDNYGINAVDQESTRPWLAALIVREFCLEPSNWRQQGTLCDPLAHYQVPICQGVDTRALTRHLRVHGAQRAVLSPPDPAALPAANDDAHAWLIGRTPGIEAEVKRLVEQARRVLPLSEQDLVAEVAPDAAAPWQEGTPLTWAPWPPPRRAPRPARVAVIDCGVKHNIPRSLAQRGLETIILPYDVSIEEVLAVQPEGIVLGNGPGDPETIAGTVATVRALLEGPTRQRGLPLMGVCLGHQLVGLAIGGTTSRLKFGHRGANHPVTDVRSRRVHITSQNHGFQVDRDSIARSTGFYVSHVNLNDGSVEGLAHQELPVFTVQYHPEAAPGPQDNQYLFDRFVDLIQSSGD